MHHQRPHPCNTLPTNYQPNQFQNTKPRGGFHRGSHQFQNIRLTQGGFRPSSSFNYDGNEEHWCETCDRGFRTADLLEKHNAQHQKCNIDGCQFIAHPKVITKHIQMQHSTGLYKKIGNLNNPEDIKRWIEERKRRYPTKENVDKKAAEVKEKLARGEKMGFHEKRFNGNKSLNRNYQDRRPAIGDKRTSNGFKNTRQNKIRKISSNNKEKITHLRKERNIKLAIDDERKLKPFAGIQDLVSDDDDEESEVLTSNCLIDDDETTLTPVEETKSSKPEICGALSSLLCDYGSSDEDNVNLQIPNTIKEGDGTSNSISMSTFTDQSTINVGHVKPIEIDVPKYVLDKKIATVNEDSDGPPEETNVIKDTNSIEPSDVKEPIIQATHAKRQRPVYHRQYISKPKPKVPSTLLQKLLFKEMRQERNMVLQCIRYIVKNNFFNK